MLLLFFFFSLVSAGPGTYAHYEGFDSKIDVSSISHNATWMILPTAADTNGNAVFVSQQHWFRANVGAYSGTQSWLDKKVNPPLMVHKAIFSAWDGDPANGVHTGWTTPSSCGRFGGEGTGAHCLVEIPLRPNATFSVSVAFAGSNASGAMWRGTVVDVSAGTETEIGVLFHPNVRGLVGYGMMKQASAAFQEYFLATGCDGQAESAVALAGPLFDGKTLPTQATPDYVRNTHTPTSWNPRSETSFQSNPHTYFINPSPNSSTTSQPSQTKDCNFSDVSGGLGHHTVLMHAGGTVQRVHDRGTPLW